MILIKDTYPTEATRLLDQYFPKNNSKRKFALAIMAMAYIEGQMNNDLKKEIKRIKKKHG